MPRLRFTRDARGYEHTFLVHTMRRRGKERTRLLYWYRSPPAVRVGRPALDPEAIRVIEQANPEIAFDWPLILQARPPDVEPAEPWRARRSRPRERDGRASEGRGASLAAWLPPVDASPSHTSAEPPAQPVGSGGPVVPDSPAETVSGTDAADRELEPRVHATSAVERALGTEGLIRVRARYAEVIARISTQVTEASVADELCATAERLNPDAWVTADDVLEGLEGFERTLESIRRRMGPPRRQGRGPQAAVRATESPDATAAHERAAEPDEARSEPTAD